MSARGAQLKWMTCQHLYPSYFHTKTLVSERYQRFIFNIFQLITEEKSNYLFEEELILNLI